MKTIYKLLMCVVVAGRLVACDTQQDVWDTGVSSPYHDCTVMEYLREDFKPGAFLKDQGAIIEELIKSLRQREGSSQIDAGRA